MCFEKQMYSCYDVGAMEKSHLENTLKCNFSGTIDARKLKAKAGKEMDNSFSI